MLLTEVRENIDKHLAGVTEGVKVRAYWRGDLKVNIDIGKTYQYYDLASLTKIMFTVAWFMKESEESRFSVDDKVSGYLSWYPHTEVSFGQLLSHSAGHRAWTGFYETLNRDMGAKSKSFSQNMMPLLRNESLEAPGRSIYSDIDFLILGCAMEEISGKSLLTLWKELNEELNLKDTGFNPDNDPRFSRSAYAPTEKCQWRNKVIQGEVHDDNTWSLGGVSSHAGLFGTIEDLVSFGILLRKIFWGDTSGFVRPETLRRFTQNATSSADWGLGFMKPSRPKSSAGSKFSAESFGHTGFTGTSIWYDPKADLLVCILSNRTYPDRNNFRFRDELRPWIHDWIYEALCS
ncbi:MAG: hypothetical protein A4S09_16680 [Proteobacteria bacterium SG_bin7]|nr:MAG: hypothetical protein A4S09_16680 [Proteobacteria bacterium SG_bin7]